MRVFIVLLLLAGGAYLGGISLHVIQTQTGAVFATKEHLTLNETYIDTSSWTIGDFVANLHVVRILERSGNADRVPQLAQYYAMKKAGGDALENISENPSTKKTIDLMRRGSDAAVEKTKEGIRKLKSLFEK